MFQRSSKRAQSVLAPMRQSTILDHFSLTNGGKRSKIEAKPVPSEPEVSHYPVEDTQEQRRCDLQAESDSYLVDWPHEPDTLLEWEKKLNRLLKKHFGYPVLKKFQKQALEAWLNHQDCLVLAATGSGTTLLARSSFHIYVVEMLVLWWMEDNLFFTFSYCFREVYLFSDPSFINRQGGGCYFAIDKLDARSMLKTCKAWGFCLFSWVWAT